MPLLPPFSAELRAEVERANARHRALLESQKSATIAPVVPAPESPEQIAARSERVARYEERLALESAVLAHNQRLTGPRAIAPDPEEEPVKKKLDPIKREVDKLNRQRQRDGYFLPKKEK